MTSLNAPDTRTSLILRLRHSDDDPAWGEFWRIYQPVVYRVARSNGLQDADCIDIVQEVMQRVSAAVDRWRPGTGHGTFRGWLRTITRNTLVQFFRQQKRIQNMHRSTSMEHAESLEADPSTACLARFELERRRQLFIEAVHEVRPQFSPETWLVFWRTAIEEIAITRVAEEFRMSPGAIYIARSRVMARLRSVALRLESHEESD